MKIVMIQWYDSRFIQGSWISKEDVRPVCAEETTAVAIGILYDETPDAITLYPYICATDVAKGITIPKITIKQMWRLKVK